MRKIHLVCNAHLDLVWLWRWDEGCTEALSTFRTASQLIDKYQGFRFNHNEAILYEWVKENEPQLFEKIKEKVINGTWIIMGGWYLQPDCNMPSGESMIRNILIGRKFFLEEFGKRPTTAINFDSFGHSKGLVQILNQAGYDSYVVCRPDKSNYSFKEQNFIWKGFNASEVIVHRSDENYNSVLGQVAQKLEQFIKYTQNETVSLFLWGVGNHGGGPSKKDLEDLNVFFEDKGESYQFIHSNVEDFFKDLRESVEQLPIVDRSLNPVAQGCYTSQIRVKQKHRQLENELYSTEKMLTAAALQCGLPYPAEKMEEVVKDLLFSEFHDALPGTGTQLVEEDTIRILDHGLEILSREKTKAFIALCQGQDKIIDGTSCAFIYNPHPYPVTDIFEFEVSLPWQNWENCFYYPKVYCNGEIVPTQAEKETSNFCIDWRKKVVVQATLKPFTVNRLDVYFEPIPKRPTYEKITGDEYYCFDNGDMKVVINTTTGLIDCYEVNGVNYLKPGSFKLNIYDDTYNSWGINSAESHCVRNMTLLTPHEGSAFSGLRDKVIPSVRVIEDGEVRTVVEAVFGCHDSYAYQRYLLPKKGTAFEVETGVYWNERDFYLKLDVYSNFEETEYFGQIMFGHEKLKTDGDEVVSQKWVMLKEKETDRALSIINQGTYGSNSKDGKIGITLLRSAGYSAADGNFERSLQEERYASRMDQGERIYRFKVNAGDFNQLLHRIDRDAQIFNEKPYALPFSSSSTGKKVGSFLLLDNSAIILSALKLAEDRKGYVIRLYESEGVGQNATIKLPDYEITMKMSFAPFEIKTLYFDPKACNIEEVPVTENY